MRLSLIVTSYTVKRLEDIGDLLAGVALQTEPVFEIIFVVEQDESLARGVEGQAGRLGIPVNVIFNNEGLGLSRARNMGAALAQGDILAFLDDDVIPSKEWSAEIIEAFQDPDVIGVTGFVEPHWDTEPILWLPEEFHWLLSCTTWARWDSVKRVRNVWGMNMAFRREAFQLGKGFETEFGLRDGARPSWIDPPSEDVDFSIRVCRASGKSIVYNPRARVRHKVHGYRLSLKFIAHRAASVGYQRRMIRQLYSTRSGEHLLGAERELLRRIATHLIPSTFRIVTRHPVLAVRKLLVTVYILFFVTLGYLWPSKDRRDSFGALV